MTRTNSNRLLTATVVAISLGLMLALVWAAPRADAAPAVAGEFTVSGVGTNNQITVGPDGNIWVTLDGGTNDVAKITPEGVVTEYNAATMTNPVGIAAGPDGKLWVTQANGVASFTPADPTTAVATAIAAISDARAITVGPDGNLWTASVGNVVKIPPAAPATFQNFAATGVTGARWTASHGGSLWVADGSGQVVQVSTAGAATAYATGGGPQGVAGGPTGQVGFSNPLTSPQTVGRIPEGGAVATTEAPMKDPFGVTFGADGAYWFGQFNGNDLGRLTTDGTYTTLGGFSAAAGPRQLTTGPDGTLWVTLDTASKIAKVTGVTAPAPSPTPTTASPTPNPTASPTPTPTPTVSPTPSGKVHTTITKKGPKVIRPVAGKKKAKVRFRFTGTPKGAMFQCKLRKRGAAMTNPAFQGCSAPKRYRLKPGKYTFVVRAVLTKADATPAKRKFTVLRRR